MFQPLDKFLPGRCTCFQLIPLMNHPHRDNGILLVLIPILRSLSGRCDLHWNPFVRDAPVSGGQKQQRATEASTEK